MSQQYSLRWNNHQPNFISMFTTLLNTQTLVDVTLAAEGKHVQAHKVVLTACSTYFHALFVENPAQHPIVILKGVTFADLRTMVDFMYYGEVNVTEDQLPRVLETAKLLKVKGLTEMPESTLTRAQGAGAPSQEYAPPNDTADSQPMPTPATSPTNKRRRRRKSSTGSTSLSMIPEDARAEEQSVQLVRDNITLSSVPQRRRDFHDEIHHEPPPQPQENQHMNMDTSGVETSASISHGGQWSMMEQAYPRYSGACGLGAGGGAQLADAAPLYMGGALNPHEAGELGEFAHSLAVAHPSPGPSCADAPPHEQQHHAQPKRRRTTNPQSEENFQRALEAVRFGGIGFCKAARMFGVNNRTLWLEYKKKGYPNNRPSIKSRIKREHTTPPPEHKDEQPPAEQQMALLCPPHPVSVGFIESRPLDFPLQGMAHGSPLNILGVNFNSMQ